MSIDFPLHVNFPLPQKLRPIAQNLMIPCPHSKHYYFMRSWL